MTPTTLAAAILRDVIRWTMADNVKFLAEHEVLAALTAATEEGHE